MSDKTLLLIGAGAVGLLILDWGNIASGAGKAVSAAAQAVDPANTNNIFYQFANSIGATVTGNKNFDLGVEAYTLTHPNTNTGGSTNPNSQPASPSPSLTAQALQAMGG